MAVRLLLVHSPLVGPRTWDLVASDLAGHGWEVAVPDLTGTVTASPPYLLRQAGVVAGSAAGQPAILVGHSGAGPVLAVAGTMIDQVHGYIFVDAELPTPGHSLMEAETVPPEVAARLRAMADAQGWLPPWPQWWGEEALAEVIRDPGMRRRFAAECSRVPLAMLEEVQPPAPQWPDAPAAYLQLSDEYQGQAAKAAELGWPVVQRISNHLAPLTDPAPTAESLRELLALLRP